MTVGAVVRIKLFNKDNIYINETPFVLNQYKWLTYNDTLCLKEKNPTCGTLLHKQSFENVKYKIEYRV